MAANNRVEEFIVNSLRKISVNMLLMIGLSAVGGNAGPATELKRQGLSPSPR